METKNDVIINNKIIMPIGLWHHQTSWFSTSRKNFVRKREDRILWTTISLVMRHRF